MGCKGDALRASIPSWRNPWGRRAFTSYGRTGCALPGRGNDAARAVVTPHPVVCAQAFHAHFSAARGRVDEAVLAQIDADVRVLAPLGVVEHQVAGSECGTLDGLTQVAEIEGVARQGQARAFPVYVGH